jgi:TldD protein
VHYSSLKNLLAKAPHYSELRAQTNSQHFLSLADGDLAENQESMSSGLSCRTFVNGGWGFASSGLQNEETAKDLLAKATKNAEFMSSANGTSNLKLPENTFTFEKELVEKNKMSTKEQVEYLKDLYAFAAKKFSDLKSIKFMIAFHQLEKSMANSIGSHAHHVLPRTSLYITFSIEHEGEVTSLSRYHGENGRPGDALPTKEALEEVMQGLYKDVSEKSVGVHATAGTKDVILAPAVAGILAHEAIGHPTEADLVKSGSVAANYLGQKVGSELVTMIDYAHSYQGKELPVPVYIDDEGVEAKDAVLIEDGVFKGYMNNRELSEFYGQAPTGSARAYDYSDEPLIRMRNTIINPGKSKLEDMIASIDDGYYFTQSSNGQADLTSEFMFGVTMGYEIKNGKLGKAIKDTTISGVAFDMLSTVDMVSDEFDIHCTGFCGKKQRMIVSHGGPSLKCRLHVGGR